MERAGSAYLPSEVATFIDRVESATVGLLGTSAAERKSLAINLLIGNVRFKGPHTHAVPEEPTA